MKTIYSISFYALTAVLVLGISGYSFAQNVGISSNGTFNPYDNALLDIDGAGGSGGLLPPRLTAAEQTTLTTAINAGTASAAEGMLIYSKTNDRYEMWVNDGGWGWKKIMTESDLGNGFITNTNVTPGQQVTADFDIDGSGQIGTSLEVGSDLKVENGIVVGDILTATPGNGNILMTVDDSWIGRGSGLDDPRIIFDKSPTSPFTDENIKIYPNDLLYVELRDDADGTSSDQIGLTIKHSVAARGPGIKLSGTRNIAGNKVGYLEFENYDASVSTTEILGLIAIENQTDDNLNGSFHIDLRSAGVQQERLVMDASGNLNIDGKFNSQGIQETSDARFKKNINSISNALSTVMNLEGVTYNWRTEEFPERSFGERMEYGVIAQQVEKFVPELVSTDKDGYKAVQYSHMVPLLLEAIKEQQEIINSQSQEIGVLKASVEAISDYIKTAEK